MFIPLKFYGCEGCNRIRTCDVKTSLRSTLIDIFSCVEILRGVGLHQFLPESILTNTSLRSTLIDIFSCVEVLRGVGLQIDCY